MSDGANLTTSRATPVADFTSADFESIKEDTRAYAQQKYAGAGWSDFNPLQPAEMLTDVQCYMGDLVTYQLNSHIRELWAGTVLRRQNLAHIGKPFNYEPPGAEAASVTMRLTMDAGGTYPMTITRVDTQVSNDANGDAQVYFQPATDTVVSAYPGGGFVDVDFLEGEFFSDFLIGVSGNTPNQRWQFPQQNVISDSIGIVVGGVTWTRIYNWTNTLSTSQVYKIVQTDDGNTYAVFGDGVQGAVPALNADIRAEFRTGGGRRGNLNKNTITKKVAGAAQILSVTNPEKAAGGEEILPMKQAREGIPSAISTLRRAVTDKDHELLAEAVSGVSKARAAMGQPNGSNRIRVWLAPNGGGQPSSVLKNSVLTSLKTKKMVGRRVSVQGPVYKDVRFRVLLHVNENYKAPEVRQVVRRGITNPDGTGLLDFAQLDFEGVAETADGNSELLLSQTRLQAYFDELKKAGLERAEILQLDVIPAARPKDSGNTGTGTVEDIVLGGRQRRREYFIELISSAQYRVHERIVGRITSLTDTSIFDHEKDFAYEGISDYSGYLLAPNRESTLLETSVGEAVDQELKADSLNGVSLFTLTEVGLEYYVYKPNTAPINVGSPFTSADGSVTFTVVAGSTPFIAGDQFTLDVFPNVSDLRLRFDEYPQLTEDSFVTRTSGGIQV